MKYKICLIIHSLSVGGMERVMAQLANNFVEREGVEVHLLLIGKKREIIYGIPESVIIHRPHFKFNDQFRTINTFRTIYFIRSQVKEIEPDTILSFGEIWNNLVLLALYKCSYRIFISDRSQPGKNLGKWHNYLRDVLYPSSAGYIAQTQEAKNLCLEKGWNKNVKVIGNPIYSIPIKGKNNKENIVLSVGRLIKTKNFDQLIRIFEELNNPDWKLVIVGGDAKKGQLSNKLKELIKELNAEKRVFLEGEKKNIDSYYRKSKIFAFTSSSEGFPNVIGEALSAGLPVISYDCKAGPSDMVIDEKNGYLISDFNQNEFRKRLSLLMENASLRDVMGKAGIKSMKKFNPDFITDEFYCFITSVN